MKATLSYKSKRNIIIASVIVVLLAAISTAGYFYIKGNDETARAFTQNEITNELTPGEQTQNNGDQQENQPQNPEQPATPGEQNNNGGEQTNNGQNQNNNQNRPNNNTTNNGSTPNQTTGNVPNQEYVTERTEERTTITKEYSVEWTPESITANASVQNLNIIRPIISANKSADKNAVVPGETITYTITVTNTGNADGKAIVKDTIPEATEFIENSIKINGEDTNYTAQNLEEGITVDVAKQNEQGEAGTVEVEFKVKVSNIFAQYEKASIINQATVNEEKTNEVKNPVIKFEKSANKEKVEVGDTVTYTISIENIGDAEGTVIVKDTIPTGTKLVENSTIKLNGEDTNYTEQILNDGIELKVKSGERLEITFEVEVLSEITEAVKNTAYVNDIPTETIPTQVESLIKFESNGGTSVESMNGYTGDVIENREMPTTTREGYTFEGWYAEPELTNKVETLPEKYPAGTTTYYAKWTANTNTKYTVEFYYQTEGNYKNVADFTDERTGTTDTLAQVTENDKNPAQDKVGYVYDESAANVLKGTIAGDGSLVLKVYFKQQFAVTYKPGTQGAFTEQTKTGLDYGTATPAFEGNTTGRPGYTFAGWQPSVARKVTSNAEYVAQWTANTDTKYTVEFYYQTEGSYKNVADFTDERTGTTDTLAQVTENDKNPAQDKVGYVYDESAANVLKGTIAGDGSLVLKVYFKQQFAVTYKPGTQGAFTEQTKTGLDYGTATPAFEGNTTGRPGYTFAGWQPSVARKVTSNAEYVAQWTANTDTKYTVEFYYQTEGSYKNVADFTDERTGTTDTLAQVTENDKNPAQDKVGYVYDESAANVLKGTIAGDGSLVLKVYFKQQFAVTYKPGTQGAFTEQTKTGLDYGTATPAFEGETTGKPGYTFEKWQPSVATEVTSNAEYVAQWTANTNTKYTVEHYLQKLNKTDEYDLKETENNLTGTTGELTNAQAKSYDGFTAQPFEQKEIAGDGTTVVKIYYTRNNYQYKIQYWYENEQGTYELLQPETVTGGEVPYGTVIDTFTPKDGDGKYVLDHVDPAKSATDNKTANLVITHEENEDGKILKNILKVYYRLNSFNYRIDYYKETANGEKFITSTGNKQQKLKTQITDAILKADFGANWKNANKPQEGYQDGIVENAEAADYYITIKENNNVIKVVYKLKTNIKYTVKYYFNEDPLKEYEYSDTAKYGQQINSVKDYSDGGWIKDKQKSTSLPYTIKESGNVIKVYYVKPEITVKKTTSVSGVVEPGQNITYTITATNTGYLAGNVTIEDSEPAGTSAANNAKATIKDSTGTKTVELSELEKGITLNVPAKNGNVEGTATVKFTVKVTGEKLKDKTSNLISNTATVNETDETNTVNNTVEKTMKIKENTETIKATNIVLVIDSSGSMDEKMDNDDGILISRCEDANCKKTHRTGWSLFIGSYKYHTKMTTAIDAACRFIDQIYPNQSTNNGTTISVVDFNTDASIVGTMATSYAGAQNLKTAIKKLEANGNTSMGTALNLANTTLTNIPAQYKDNNNVVIFLSDGAPTDGNAYQAAATTLKTGANKATIYTIGFEIDNTGAQVLSAIATGEKYAFLTDMDKLFETFDDISSSIKESTITKQSKGGKLTLTNVDTTKPIKINGVKVELTDKKLNKIDDTTYEIVLSEFSVSELENEISVEYFSK